MFWTNQLVFPSIFFWSSLESFILKQQYNNVLHLRLSSHNVLLEEYITNRTYNTISSSRLI